MVIEEGPNMVRKWMRLERKRRGWGQMDLAEAAGIKSRTTIQQLENGQQRSEGVEGAVELALGWKLGSLDRIRAGLEPIAEERTPALDEIPEMTGAEMLQAIDTVRRLKGNAAARQFRANVYAYLERATESKPEVQR